MPFACCIRIDMPIHDIHQSGGEIYVTSALDEGTAVDIYLPEMKQRKAQNGPHAAVSRVAGS